MAEVVAGTAEDEPEIEIPESEPETPADDPAPEPVTPEEHAEPTEPKEPEGEEGRKRGPDGKFAKDKTPAQKVAEHAKLAQPKAPEVQIQPALPALKPPADWRPAAREEFAKLPRVVQEEAVRLHLETKKTLQDSAQSRQTADAFTRGLAPYEHMFRSAGKSLPEGAAFLAQTYATLQTAPLPQRAQLIGGFIRDFLGTDENAINLLAQQLDGKGGQGPQGGASPAAPIRPEQIQQMVRSEAQRMAAEQQQQSEAKAVNDFEAQPPEFLASVTQEMLALATIEKRQGKTITTELLKSLYERAIKLNPETAAILKQRDDAASAKKKQEDAIKRRAAASGLRNEPPGPGANGTPKARTTREEMARQFAKASSDRA